MLGRVVAMVITTLIKKKMVKMKMTTMMIMMVMMMPLLCPPGESCGVGEQCCGLYQSLQSSHSGEVSLFHSIALTISAGL